VTRYLTELADWLQGAGLAVVEYLGWETRARSSGGYADGRPWCVMWHHTASKAHPSDDAAYCAEGDPDAPICNLLIDRTGLVWIIAAGATNTNGKGYALQFSRGVVPDDQMNTYAVGVEICNDGIGEAYPQEQIDVAFAASLAVCRGLGLEATDAAQHHDWAPDRKIDPARADSVAGPWTPHPINNSGSWSLVDLRAELARRAGAPAPIPPSPDPPTVEDAMPITAVLDPDGSGRVWIGDGMGRRVVPSLPVFNNYVILSNAGCSRLVNANGQQVRDIADVFQVGPDTLEALGPPV
jgi:hypothetical protein